MKNTEKFAEICINLVKHGQMMTPTDTNRHKPTPAEANHSESFRTVSNFLATKYICRYLSLSISFTIAVYTGLHQFTQLPMFSFFHTGFDRILLDIICNSVSFDFIHFSVSFASIFLDFSAISSFFVTA